MAVQNRSKASQHVYLSLKIIAIVYLGLYRGGHHVSPRLMCNFCKITYQQYAYI